jgi:dinuclear metal center YbgI/SA1388 family protein
MAAECNEPGRHRHEKLSSKLHPLWKGAGLDSAASAGTGFDMANLAEIQRFLDRYLKIDSIQDYPGAFNGLQVENSGRVTRVAAAVDAGEPVLRKTLEIGADLLLVHHGLFWGRKAPVTGVLYRKLSTILGGNLAVYSAHLPLDLHPVVGNGVLLGNALGLSKGKPFLEAYGSPVGMVYDAPMTRAALQKRLEKAVEGPVHLCPGGKERIRKIAVVTGGAGGEVEKVAAAGVDTLVTGEGPHHSYVLAEELGVNVFYAGHYATETFGVKALAQLVSKRFRIPRSFVDHPTGL